MIPSAQTDEVKVWDVFVRVTHWVIVIGFFLAYFTEDELLPAHVWAGYIVGGLVVARILWGFVGPPRARFSDFIYAPRAVVSYLLDLLRFRAPRYLGHSPAGGAMVILLLLGLASTVATGLVLYGARDGAGPLGRFYSATAAPTGVFVAMADTKRDKERDGGMRSDRRERRQETKVLKEVHELLANLTLGLVVLHIAGVLWASAAHRENLIRAMITGRKRRDEAHGRFTGSAGAPQPRAM